MRQHANRIKTELIARKGKQLTGQSPTICACGKSVMHLLAGHMSITFMPSFHAFAGRAINPCK